MTIQEIREQRARVATMPEKRQKLLQLAQSVYNNMGFAAQNAGRFAEEKYERKASDALAELTQMLLNETEL